jgi:peptide/nickel transport system permease protein
VAAGLILQPEGGSARRRRLPEWMVVLGRAAATRRGRLGLTLAGLVVAIAVLGPFVAPKSPTEFVAMPFSAPSGPAVFGADVLGRDVLSRVLAGGFVILTLAAIATAIGVAVGTSLGVAAGYMKGSLDEVIMRTLDVALAFPQIILALLLVSIIGPELWLVCAAVAAIHAPQVARVARSATLRAAEEDFVKNTEAFGLPRWKIMLTEILPNIISPLMVETGLRLTYSISLIASLSFLGFGLQPPAPDWGVIINENRIAILSNAWPVVIPILLIAILTVGVNLFSDAIARSALGIEAPIGPVQARTEAAAL